MTGGIPEILYEDNHLIAVNKSNSDLVQQDITGDPALNERLKAYLKEKYNKPGNVYLGVSHRLDRPVSGVVLFARTGKSLSRLNEMFRSGKIGKEYHAIVKNKPPKSSDELIHYLIKNGKQNKSYCHEIEMPGSKEARMKYEIAGRSHNYYLLQIQLYTGRHHQIRAQLAYIGCPVRGDLKYGYDRSNPNGGISLHASKIEFIHPVKGELLTIRANPPANEPLWGKFG